MNMKTKPAPRMGRPPKDPAMLLRHDVRAVLDAKTYSALCREMDGKLIDESKVVRLAVTQFLTTV